jgi:hypothetical protein
MKTLIGGGVPARRTDHRQIVVEFLIPLLGVLGKCRGRGWSPLAVALASILMSWDPAPTLAQRFENARGVLRGILPRRWRLGRTYQGFVKAMMRHSDAAMEPLLPHLRTLTREAAGRDWTIRGLVPIAVDGSMVDAPRTMGNEALGFVGKDKCGPQIRTLLLIHLGAMLPWSFALGEARTSERALLHTVLPLLPENTLLVADAGFVGFDLLSMLKERGTHFLVRVGRGVRLLRDLGCYKREGVSTVYLWPDARRQCEPLVLRLIRVGSVYLVTDITDPRRLSAKIAGDLYRRRWGIEVAFRSLKQTLEHCKVRSGTALHSMTELKWAIVGSWMLSLMGAHQLARAGIPPRRLSLAKVISAVRAARAGHLSKRAFRTRLRGAVQDTYRRRGSKKAYRWPHKKRPPPPGAPQVTKATEAQVHAAKRLGAAKTTA